MRLDRNRIDHIEKDISPPMKYAITIPVEWIGEMCGPVPGLCIYVSASPFSDGDDSVLRVALRSIANSIQFKQESVPTRNRNEELSSDRTPVGSDIPVSEDCVMSINAVGRVTQNSIEALIQYLNMIKASFPIVGAIA